MLKILRFLFTGSWHTHKFVESERHEIYRKPSMYYHDQRIHVSSYLMVLKCSCGKLKNHRINASID